MIEGPYNSNRSSWLSDRLADFEVIGLAIGFLAGCYFLGKAAWVFWTGTELVKLGVLGLCVLIFVSLFFVVSQTWRIALVLLFASVGPVFEYVLQ